MLRIAVTGASGDVGMGTLRALRAGAAEGGEGVWLLALDAQPERVPPPLADALVAMPFVRDPEYAVQVEAVLREHRIEVLLPCIDGEIVRLSRARDAIAASGATVVLAPEDLVEAADDKLATAAYLAARGVPVAGTWIPASAPPDLEAPVVVKPRQGHGSAGVRVLGDHDALARFRAAPGESECLQEYLDGPELTVGLVYDRDGVLRDALALRREVDGGRTVRATVVDDRETTDFVAAFGRAVRGIGAINVQLRVDRRRGPVVFEVNARLSGSTPMRAAVGFNDPIRIARHFARGAAIEPAVVRRATVYRYLAEWVVPE